MWLFVELADMYHMRAKIFVTVIAMIWNYVMK